jgi:hypothetical protein
VRINQRTETFSTDDPFLVDPDDNPKAYLKGGPVALAKFEIDGDDEEQREVRVFCRASAK